MSERFDPYQVWLEVPAEEQPPDYYRLLGVRRFEKRPEVIEAAAEARLAALQPHRGGEYAPACQRMIGEVNVAKLCLLNENRRGAYDVRLLQQVAAAFAEAEKGDEAVQITAEEFLAVLRGKDLIPAELWAALRRQIGESKSHTSARHVAKLLVDKGLLTPLLAKRLLRGEPKGSRQADKGPEGGPRKRNDAADLKLAPLDDEPEGPTGKRKVARSPGKNRGSPEASTRPAAESPSPARRSTKRPEAWAGSSAASDFDSLLDEELALLSGTAGGAGGGPIDGLLDNPSLAAAGTPLLSAPPRQGLWKLLPRRRYGGRPWSWTSPGFLITAGILWTALILGGMAIWALTRPSVNDRLKSATEAPRESAEGKKR